MFAAVSRELDYCDMFKACEALVTERPPCIEEARSERPSKLLAWVDIDI